MYLWIFLLYVAGTIQINIHNSQRVKQSVVATISATLSLFVIAAKASKKQRLKKDFLCMSTNDLSV